MKIEANRLRFEPDTSLIQGRSVRGIGTDIVVTCLR